MAHEASRYIKKETHIQLYFIDFIITFVLVLLVTPCLPAYTGNFLPKQQMNE